MEMESMRTRPLRVYFIPFFTPGHMIPFSEFARLFASRGVHVTIITTPCNAQLLQNSVEEDRAAGYHIEIHTVKFPSEEVGLPEGVENLYNSPEKGSAGKLLVAGEIIRQKMEPFINQNPPDCIASDFLYPWTTHLANRLGIPSVVFNPIPVFAICMADAVNKNPHVFNSDSGPYLVPGLPHPIKLPIKPPQVFTSRIETLIEGQVQSYGLLLNSFAEVDGEEYIKHYKKISGHKVWHIGPASLMLPKTGENKNEVNDYYDHASLTWLKSKEPGSVVFVSFGTICRLSDGQLYEMACGLESSGAHFLWVVQGKDNQSEEDKEKWLPKGFEQRMKENNGGLVVTGWAPQPAILKDPAIGAFLTHCGWSSAMEGISSGVPMITFPVFYEQFYNERLIAQVHGIGVELGAQDWWETLYDAKDKLVSRDNIENAIRRIMDGGEEAKEVRRKAREMGENASKAVQEGGSSQKNLTDLIEDLKCIAISKGTAIIFESEIQH